MTECYSFGWVFPSGATTGTYTYWGTQVCEWDGQLGNNPANERHTPVLFCYFAPSCGMIKASVIFFRLTQADLFNQSWFLANFPYGNLLCNLPFDFVVCQQTLIIKFEEIGV